MKISSALKNPEYTQIEKSLVSMRKLLILSMKQYNLDKADHLKKSNEKTKLVDYHDAELINRRKSYLL